MINEENLNKLYDGVINDNELTTKKLNSYGFNSKDLADLIERGSLERLKRGYYSFQSIDELSHYGKKLIVAKEYEKATECFKKCYELDSNHSSVLFSDVIRFLMKSDIENAFRTLINYMESINKRKYEFLIVDLIKLSLIEKDIAFTKPMIALIYISRENFEFDISNYIQEFYITLAQNRFDEARIYLDIISKSDKLGQDCILTEGLLQVLNNTEKEFAKNQNFTIQQLNTNLISVKTSNPITQIESHRVEEILNEEKTISSKEIGISEKEFIESKHELLLNGQGVVLLKPMNNEKRKRIHDMVKEYADMVSFSIGEGDNEQIVLRYKPFSDGYVDFKKLINMGNAAYKKGNYDSCIEYYLQLLQFGEPKAGAYAKLGLAYYNKFENDIAIDYFTIATQLSKKEDGKFDFTEMIEKIQLKMKNEDFENDVQNHYGIENFDEITSFILESGLDVETACKKLDMTDEQIDTIRLIYAREFYSQGFMDKGDQFLRSVEKSKNKTKFTSKLFEEIGKNKKFYINRSSEKPQQLVLTLQP